MKSGKIKKILIATVSIVIGLPVLMILAVIVAIQVLDQSTGSIESSGKEREYLLYVPKSYDADTPAALVISLHGGATWPAHQKNLTGWNRLADDHGFIVVYPSGSGMPKIWYAVHPGPGVIRDSKFISELIDALMADYNIDPTRIYADGLSNGGGMAFVLSCTLSERIAAIGMVAAAQSIPVEWCESDRPVPTIAFHGTADPIIPFEGGLLGDPFNPVKPTYPPVREWAFKLSKRNDCMSDPVESVAAPGVTRIEYINCAGGASVILHVIQGGGHTWPGGKPMPEWRVGLTSDSIDATSEIWAFFLDQTLSRQQTELGP
jgi:polyhydroxybutyrate depolymerase